MAFFCLAATCLLATAHADDTLTLEQALSLGKQYNGTIVAAMRDLDAAKAKLVQSKSGFFPSLTLSYGYSDQRFDNYKVPSNDPLRTTFTRGTSGTLSADWTLLDTGERELGVKSATDGLESQQASTLQTLRSTLVDVYTRYVEALRSQELQKAAQAEVARADDVLKQAEAQAKVGDIAQKDVLQPRADALNAKVSLLAAQNGTTKSQASLKAGIGWDYAKDLPALAPLGQPTSGQELSDTQAIIRAGLQNRNDLKAERKFVDQLSISVRQAKLAYGPTLNAGYSYTRQGGSLADSGNGVFSVFVSYPLFDGFSRKSDIRIAEANLAAAKADLTQAEREAAAEIESLVRENELDRQRIEAANAALEAARTNFDKVYQAKQLGAEGADVVALSTAQSSLVTAETNAIQATYDYAIAQVRLRLATGLSVPGEPE
ncbi:MAG TPA: TolC family protein [Fimbriimonadaceae bacterium]|nr:TolC family protein [Fimbriimonadaceae bacterium]